VLVRVFASALCLELLTFTVAVHAQGDIPSAKLALDGVLNLEVRHLADKMDADAAGVEGLKDVTVDWRKAFLESGLFIVLMNGKRAALEPWTQAGMKGPFFKDYWRSIKGSVQWKWKDGDDFFINYIRHPAEGATFAFIMRRNDPNSIDPASCGFSKNYFKQTIKTVFFSAIASTLFEIGPVSEASIGNVGYFKESGLVDFVVTPTVGVAFMIGQDLLDNYVIRNLERKIDNKIFLATLRVVLNPTRSLANALAFKKPWYRKRGKLEDNLCRVKLGVRASKERYLLQGLHCRCLQRTRSA
jgi:hypothetical protein